MTASELVNRLRGKTNKIVIVENGVRVYWKKPPSREVEESLQQRSSEIWCLVARGWRDDCNQCPSCGEVLVRRKHDARTYLECTTPVHYSQDLTGGDHTTQ